MKAFFDKLYNALRSVKLAVVLLVLLALFAIAGGIIPQGKAASYYIEHFSRSGSRIILALALDHVFSSFLFLLVSAIFAINLTVCTFHRLTSEFFKPREKRRHGPDLLHIGLIILLFGGILTSRSRTETFINLRKGDSARLPGGAKLVLVDLKYEQYPDGRPKSWESTVAIDKNPPPEVPAPVLAHEEGGGDTLGTTGFADPTLNNSLSNAKASNRAPAVSSAAPAAPAIPTDTKAGAGLPSFQTSSAPIAELPQYRIRVNKPLRLKGYSIYQQNWHTEKQVVLKDAMGMQFFLEPGMRETTKDGFVLFMALDTSQSSASAKTANAGAAPVASAVPSAIFLLEQNGKRTVVKAAPGQRIGLFTFDGFVDQPVSGLAVVSDKGYPFVATGFILVILGVFITYIRKLKGTLA